MIRLLYLEDEPKISFFVLAVLRDLQDIVVTHVATYAATHGKLAEIDVIFSDVNCPGKTGRPDDKFGLGGFDLLRDVQQMERETGRVIPFAFTSSNPYSYVAEQIEKHRLQLLPSGHFVQKPITSISEIEEITALLVQNFIEKPETTKHFKPTPQPMSCVTG